MADQNNSLKKCAICSAIVEKDLITCPNCGSGVFESQKIKSIFTEIRQPKASGTKRTEYNNKEKRLSVDQLRFEIDKRQRQIINLQSKISRKSRDLEALYNEYERNRAANPAAYDDWGAYPGGLDTIPKEIQQMERQIYKLENEINKFEEELNKI